jgi:putative ABC transport system permease protein
MTRGIARRNAALLALKWHAGTGALVALTAALTLAGAIPALTVLGGTRAAPSLTLALRDSGALLADWGGRGVAWPQLQQLALLQLLTVVRGATLLVLAIGAATLIALHLARTAARSTDVIVARSVGASRRDALWALSLEAGALASVALCVGMVLALVAVIVMRSTWPGNVARADLMLSAAGVLGVTALVMIAPLLLVRALSTSRLVDDDRRPLTLIIPGLQLGAALVVLCSAVTLRGLTTSQQLAAGRGDDNTTWVQQLRARETDRLLRAQQFAAWLAAQHAASPQTLVSLASSGMHRGFGVTSDAMSECGQCVVGPMVVPYRSAPMVHHVVSGDSFAVAHLRVIAGRAITDADRWDAPRVVVVSARLAREMFANGDAVGHRINLSLLDGQWFEVVGIVEDQPARGLGAGVQPPYALYVSVLQHPVAQLEVGTLNTPVAADALAGVGAARTSAVTLATVGRTDLHALRWFTTLLTSMSVLAVLIALGGLIVMLSLWLDSQRTEFAIRRAVGARSWDVHRLVLGRALMVAVGGALFGAWLGMIVWDVLPRVVPGASEWDGPVVLRVAIGLTALTVGIAWGVARRFTRTSVVGLLAGVT